MYFKIKVETENKKESIEKIKEDSFKIKVREKAENNQANIRVLELLSIYLKVSKSKLKIIKGHKNKNKIIILR